MLPPDIEMEGVQHVPDEGNMASRDLTATPCGMGATRLDAGLDQERPPRVCDACGGDGGWDVTESAPGTFDGTHSYYVPCNACGETGEVEDDSEPVTEDDLIDMEWARAS